MGRGRPHKCPYCEATTSVAKGFRYNKGGKVRLRRCKACGRRWTTGPVQQDQSSAITAGEDQVPVPDEHPRGLFVDAPDHTEVREEATENDDETERRTELSLSVEGSPNQNDPGEEKNEESEETFIAQ